MSCDVYGASPNLTNVFSSKHTNNWAVIVCTNYKPILKHFKLAFHDFICLVNAGPITTINVGNLLYKMMGLVAVHVERDQPRYLSSL